MVWVREWFSGKGFKQFEIPQSVAFTVGFRSRHSHAQKTGHLDDDRDLQWLFFSASCVTVSRGAPPRVCACVSL